MARSRVLIAMLKKKINFIIIGAAIMTCISNQIFAGQLDYKKLEEFSGSDDKLQVTLLTGLRWKNVSLTNNRFNKVSFEDSEFEDVDLEGSTFSDVIFRNVKLKNVKLPLCAFNKVIFDNCKLTNVTMPRASRAIIKFRNSNIEGLSLTDAMADIQFLDTDIKEGVFSWLQDGSSIVFERGYADLSTSGGILSKFIVRNAKGAKLSPSLNIETLYISGDNILLGLAGSIINNLTLEDCSFVKPVSFYKAKINNMIVRNSNSENLDLSGVDVGKLVVE